MYKIRFQEHKETIVGVGLILIFLVLVAINLIVILPAIREVYFSSHQPVRKNPINTETVNEAIEYLNGEK
jgi:hypothetical protein